MKAQNDIRGLIGLLNHRDFSVQWQAANALGMIGQKAIDALQEALDDPHRNVRLGAIEALGQIRAPTAVPALTKLLEKDRNMELRWAAALALGEIGDKDSVPVLVRRLSDPDKYVRFGAALALDRLNWVPENPQDSTWYQIAKMRWKGLKDSNTISIEALIRAATDRDPRVRREALKELGELESPLGCAAIAPVLKEQRTQILWKAILAFEKCRVPDVYFPIGRVKRPRLGKNPWVVAFLNLFFLGQGYSYLGIWWGGLLVQTNLTLIVVTSLLVGPLIPTAVSYSISSVFSIHSWFMARDMIDVETEDLM